MKKHLSLMIVTALATSLLSGCGAKETDTTNKVVEQTTQQEVVRELKVQTRLKDGELAPENIELYNDLHKEINISIDWQSTPETGWNEKKSLLFASNELPDAFFGTWILEDDEVLRYGNQGLLIPIEDYINPETTPNLVKIFEEYPEYKKAITAPDGHIYSLPAFDDGFTTTTSNPLFINKAWLEAVNMDIPTTTEEFYDVLKAFKEQDANGNGDPNDEIPFTFKTHTSDMFALFGLPDMFTSHISVRDGQVVFSAMEDEYKEAIKYFNRLFSEGLIDEEAFTQDGKTLKAKMKAEERILGSYQTWRSSSWALTDNDDSYIVVPPLESPNGTSYWPERINGINSKGAFSITSKCSNPELAMEWVDHFYEPMFALQASMRLKVGLHIEEQEDGTYKTILQATDENRKGIVPGVFAKIGNVTSKAASLMQEVPAHIVEKRGFDEVYKDHYYPEQYPKVYFTIEENEKLAILKTDLIQYANEMYAKWIANGGIDKDWDSYIKKLNDMGVEEYIQIYQAAMDRYNS